MNVMRSMGAELSHNMCSALGSHETCTMMETVALKRQKGGVEVWAAHEAQEAHARLLKGLKGSGRGFLKGSGGGFLKGSTGAFVHHVLSS